MANKKISELTSATLPLAGTEELAIVQGGETKKVASSELSSGGKCVWFYSNDFTGLDVTGTTLPVFVLAIEIPKIHLEKGKMEIEIFGERTATVSSETIVYLSANSSATDVSAGLLGQAASGSAINLRNVPLRRSIIFNNSTSIIQTTTPTLSGADNTTTGVGNYRNERISFNLKNNNFIIISLRNFNIDSIVKLSGVSIKIYNE